MKNLVKIIKPDENLSEILSENEIPGLTGFDLNILYQNQKTKFFTSDDWNIIYVLRGKLNVYKDGKKNTLKDDQCLIMHPGEKYVYNNLLAGTYFLSIRIPDSNRYAAYPDEEMKKIKEASNKIPSGVIDVSGLSERDTEHEANKTGIVKTKDISGKYTIPGLREISLAPFRPLQKVDLHDHDERWEIFYIRRGEFEIGVEKDTYRLLKNHCIVIPPNTMHSERNPSPDTISELLYFSILKQI